MKLSIVSFQKALQGASMTTKTTTSPPNNSSSPPALIPSTHLDSSSFKETSTIHKKRNSTRRKDGLIMTQRTEIVEPCESQYFNDPQNGCMFYSFPLSMNSGGHQQKRANGNSTLATTPNKKRKRSTPSMSGKVLHPEGNSTSCEAHSNSSSDSSPPVLHLHQISFNNSTHALIENETPNFVNNVIIHNHSANGGAHHVVRNHLKNHHSSLGFDHSSTKPQVIAPPLEANGSSTSTTPSTTTTYQHHHLLPPPPSSSCPTSHSTHTTPSLTLHPPHLPVHLDGMQDKSQTTHTTQSSPPLHPLPPQQPPVRLSISIKELLND